MPAVRAARELDRREQIGRETKISRQASVTDRTAGAGSEIRYELSCSVVRRVVADAHLDQVWQAPSLLDEILDQNRQGVGTPMMGRYTNR